MNVRLHRARGSQDKGWMITFRNPRFGARPSVHNSSDSSSRTSCPRKEKLETSQVDSSSEEPLKSLSS